jgi:hypothetical protein
MLQTAWCSWARNKICRLPTGRLLLHQCPSASLSKEILVFVPCGLQKVIAQTNVMDLAVCLLRV